MPRVQLRDARVLVKDGLTGTALVNEAGVAIGDTDMTIDTVALNTVTTDLVPVGARFTLAGDTTVYTVTDRTPAGAGPTTNIVFSPALATAPADDDTITFIYNGAEVKIGSGNITWEEGNTYEYELDRDRLDEVRETEDVPMSIEIEFAYEQICTGTGESVTVADALKFRGGASEWVNADSDPCAPPALDICVLHNPTCLGSGGAENELLEFPTFRSDTRGYNIGEANISVSGRCNAVEPTCTRGVTQHELLQ